MAMIFTESDFVPGVVISNWLELDPDRPLEDQVENLYEGEVVVQFPDGRVLDVDWRPSLDVSGKFYVTLSEATKNEEWKPFMVRTCRPIAELRRLVAEMVHVARTQPPKGDASPD